MPHHHRIITFKYLMTLAKLSQFLSCQHPKQGKPLGLGWHQMATMRRSSDTSMKSPRNGKRVWQQPRSLTRLQNSGYVKLLEYPLVAITFSIRQCNDSMRPILATGLPVAGYICSFPHSIIHGPRQWGGVEYSEPVY